MKEDSALSSFLCSSKRTLSNADYGAYFLLFPLMVFISSMSSCSPP